MKSNAAVAMPAERRMYQRREVDFAASIRFADGSTLPCRVKNVSPMGALLEFSKPTQLPKMFRLLIVSEMFSAECELRHETGNQAGVMFTTSRMEALARFG